eukprot:9154976-Alexandrium_andersonii.AAC.1
MPRTPPLAPSALCRSAIAQNEMEWFDEVKNDEKQLRQAIKSTSAYARTAGAERRATASASASTRRPSGRSLPWTCALPGR